MVIGVEIIAGLQNPCSYLSQMHTIQYIIQVYIPMHYSDRQRLIILRFLLVSWNLFSEMDNSPSYLQCDTHDRLVRLDSFLS